MDPRQKIKSCQVWPADSQWATTKFRVHGTGTQYLGPSYTFQRVFLPTYTPMLYLGCWAGGFLTSLQFGGGYKGHFGSGGSTQVVSLCCALQQRLLPGKPLTQAIGVFSSPGAQHRSWQPARNLPTIQSSPVGLVVVYSMFFLCFAFL